MNETDKLVEDQFKSLPQELQKAINTVPWKSTIKEIALLNKIPLEQVEIIERETMFILYGFENPSDYIENIMRETQINEENASSIAEAVNEKILKVMATKVDELGKSNSSAVTPVQEISHNNLPMVEEGELAHTVPHVEQPAAPIQAPAPSTYNPVSAKSELKRELETVKNNIPDVRYPGGKDPYREPLV